MNKDNKIENERLEGKNPVLEALRSERTLNKLWVQKGGKKQDRITLEIIGKAKAAGVAVIETEKQTMDKMSVTRNHQGFIAQIAAHEYVDLDNILSECEKLQKQPFLLLLDGLKDSYNLGSVLRIADAAGVDGIVIPKHRSVGLDANVAKASAGAIEHVKVAKVTNLSDTIENLKEKGFWIIGTKHDGELSYDKVDYKGKIAIVTGSEGEGMRKHVENKCDFLVKIPSKGKVNSLNAAVATGIIVYEAFRQREVQAGD